jgi:hypothetical protein
VPSGPDFLIKKKQKQNNTTSGFSTRTKKGFAREISPQQRKRETNYLGQNELGNGLYDVEIFTTYSNDLVVTAKHVQKIDNFVI